MSVESTIKAVLEGDATLLATATGGVWSFDETGHMGISRTLTPTAFDSTGVIKPCVLVAQRNANPGLTVPDDASQVMDVRQVVECYCYSDASFATIATMKDRVYALLHAQRLTGPVRVDWAGDFRGPRDLDLDAWVERSDYLCVYVRSV